jgi:hypothetical protein
MPENRPTLQGLAEVLDEIAGDARIPSNFTGWIRNSLRTSGWKIRALEYVLRSSRSTTASGSTSSVGSNPTPPSLLDVVAQFASTIEKATWAPNLCPSMKTVLTS